MTACEPAVREAMAAVEKNRDDAEAFAALLYATLAMRDAEFTAKALPLLTKSTGKDDALAAARTIAKALLADRGEIDAAALSKVVSDGVAGEDLTVLLAMACRRAGGDSWAASAERRELIGEQPLDGNLVVLVNRLAAGQLPLVAAELEAASSRLCAGAPSCTKYTLPQVNEARCRCSVKPRDAGRPASAAGSRRYGSCG